MVHDDVNSKRKKKKSKPLERVARDLAKKYKLVIFDELEILDIADAMIVSNLFNLLIDKGVSFIITSNYKPKHRIITSNSTRSTDNKICTFTIRPYKR